MHSLTLLLRPRWGNDTVDSMTVSATFPAEGFPSDPSAPSLEYPDQAFGGLCPFPEWEELTVSDDLGEIPFWTAPAPSLYSAATFQGLYFQRVPKGTVRWSLRLLPRILPDGYRSSPYYDFRAEPLGLNGSGMFSFLLPATGMTEQLDVHLDWDLSEMPAGARGIWSYGEGPVDRQLTQWQTMLTLYQTGLMQSVEQDGFGVYWFQEPYFDVRSVAERLLPIYLYERSYFHDTQSQFRVFLRSDPFRISGGGSACPYAFISGYSAFGGMDSETWFGVLIHEMTHTWPSMTDFHVGEGTWFSEGATEYYCTLLPYRGGFVDAAFTADRLNEKIRGRYYTNPFRDRSNEEIARIQWQEREAQRLPYGRGFLYLANLEAKLQRRGLGSIDEIVMRHSILNPMTLQEWEGFVQEKLGDEGLRDFEDMKSGKLLLPEENLFGDELIAVPDEIELNGATVRSYHWEVRT